MDLIENKYEFVYHSQSVLLQTEYVNTYLEHDWNSGGSVYNWAHLL